VVVEKVEDAVSGKCAKCGGELVQQETGRPSRYCSKACRRAAEYELRRIQRRLEDLEVSESNARRELSPAARMGGSREFRQAEHQWYVGELDRLERRLKELLD
jgi:hypothetical protein